MADHNQLGKEGENQARIYLENNGYAIRHTNYRMGKLELDIVAEKDGWLIIVEVRTRTSNFHMSPEASIDKHKIRNLVFAANGYIRQFNWQGETRFDIITVMGQAGGKCKIEHIIDAFLPPVG